MPLFIFILNEIKLNGRVFEDYYVISSLIPLKLGCFCVCLLKFKRVSAPG